jgi:hypothetical protein
MHPVIADVCATLKHNRLKLLDSRRTVIGIPIHAGGPLRLRQWPGPGEKIQFRHRNQLSSSLPTLIDRADESVRASRGRLDAHAVLAERVGRTPDSQFLNSHAA